MEYCLGFDRSTAIFTSGKYFNVEEQPLLQLKITLLGIMGINEYKPPNSFKGDHGGAVSNVVLRTILGLKI